MKTKLILISMICLVAFSCKNNSKKDGSVEATTEQTATAAAIDDTRGYIVNVGDMAPDFDIEYTDGKVVKLSDLRGKLVVLQFTASWCGVCRQEMPHIESEIWLKHKDNPKFAFIGIDLKEDKETTDKFAAEMKVTYPITLDVTGAKFELFADKGAGVTRNIVIDKSGKIIMLTRLYDEAEFAIMVTLINDYLAKN